MHSGLVRQSEVGEERWESEVGEERREMRDRNMAVLCGNQRWRRRDERWEMRDKNMAVL